MLYCIPALILLTMPLRTYIVKRYVNGMQASIHNVPTYNTVTVGSNDL